jgi:hypothetical protein
MSTMETQIASLVRIAEERFEAGLDTLRRDTDRMFSWLLGIEWVFAVVLAILVSPYAWEGKTRAIHAHVLVAVGLGGLIVAVPIALARLRPGETLTRHTVAVGQILMSALLIHLSGGRIETHFHIFGSLAFLAFYRDWKVVTTATLVVVADHLGRGFFFPESVYGIANPEWWRFLEHAFWVVFIDAVLYVECARGIRAERSAAEQSAQLEALALAAAGGE